MSATKRKDKSRVVLRSGEVQRTNGSYQYSWMDSSGKRRYVYAKTLEELRIKERCTGGIEENGANFVKVEHSCIGSFQRYSRLQFKYYDKGTNSF